MQSSSRLERPAEWPTGVRAKYVTALVFVLSLSAGSVLVGFGYVAIGKPAALKYALIFAALFLLVAAFAMVTRVRPQHRPGDLAVTTHNGLPATEIRYSGAAFAILAALVACLAAIFLFGSLDFVFADDVPAAPVGAALFGLAGLFFLSFFVLVALGRLRRGRIVLSQNGIYQHGRAFISFLPWEAFAGIKAAFNDRPEILVIAYTNAPWERRQLGGPWKIEVLPPVPMIEIDSIHLAVDPTLVYHFVRFYLENPEARIELGTEASLRRARTGAFQ